MTLPPSLSHERCSELLRPLVGGELGPGEIGAVEAHLAACDACRQELAAVRSLLTAPAGAMDDLERARMRTGVTAGIRAMAESGSPEVGRAQGAAARSPEASRRRRVQPGAWVGVAAATLILFVGGLAYLGSGDVFTGGSDQGGAAGVAERAQDGGGTARAPGAAQEDLATARPAPGPRVVRDRPEFSDESLAALGRTAPVFRALAGDARPDDLDRSRARFASELERGLDGARVGSCVKQTLDATLGGLPVYGALGALEGRRVLVLGFIIPGSPGGGDRFVVKWWSAPRGEDGECPQPLGRSRGTI